MIDVDKHLRVLIRYRDVYGKAATREDLQPATRVVPRDKMLAGIARLSAVMAANDPSQFEFQKLLCSKLLSADVVKNIVESRKGEKTPKEFLIFAPQQVKILAKVFLMNGIDKIEEGPSDRERLDLMSKAFLMASDLIDPQMHKDNISEDEIVSDTIRSYYANNIEHFSHVLARYWDLLVKFPKEPEAPQLTHSFDQLCEQVVGVSLNDYLSIGLALLLPLVEVTKDNFTNHPVGIDLEKRFASSRLSTEVVRKVAIALSQPVAEAAAEAAREHYGAPFHNDFLFAQLNPFVRFGDNVLVPFSIDTVIEKLTGGLYWTILNGLPNEDLKRTFMRELGYTFEQYVYQRILEPFMGPVCLPGKYKDGKQEKEATDFLILQPPNLFLVECKTARLNYGTKATGRLDLYEKDLKKGYLEAVDQLNAAVDTLREGKLDGLLGMSNLVFKRIWPVVVLLDPFVLNPFISKYLIGKHKEQNSLQQDGVETPTVMAIEDLEHCEVLMQGGVSLCDLIKEKREDKEFSDSTFQNFLFYRHRAALQKTNDRLKKVYWELVDLVGKNLLGSDLEGSSMPPSG